MKRFAAIAVVSALGASSHGATAEWITIVVPGKPTATQSFAAEELGNYLHRITGRQVRLWPDLPAWGELDAWRKAKDTFFIVGDTRFAQALKKRCTTLDPEAYCLHSDGNLLYLVGATDRATLYAVYDYLSKLGCRWLTPQRDGEVVPRLDSLPGFDFDEFHRPANSRRDLCDFANIGPELIPWMVRNRINSAAAQSQLDASWGRLLDNYWNQRGGCVLIRYFGHSFRGLVPESLFGQHPEWFALIDNERRPKSRCHYWNVDFRTQFCTSNPQAVRHVIETVDAWFDAHPDYTAFGLVPEDGGHWCQCDGCRALDRKPTGHAGRVIALAGAVARAIEGKHPDKEILVLAYADQYLEPPEGLDVHPQVRVQVCVWPNYLQPIAGSQTDEGQHYYRQFTKWAERKCKLGTWLYQLYASPTPFDLSIRALALNARTYRDLGSDYVLHECGAERTWRKNPMATWCWMQLAWDPDLDWRTLIRDFCGHYYGAAGEQTAGVFLGIERRLEESGALFKEDVYTAEFVAEVRSDLARAKKLADSELTRKRIQAVMDVLPDPAAYATPLPEGRWFHVAATWRSKGESSELALHVDGRRVAEQAGPGKTWNWKPAETIYLGRKRHRGGFNGRIDEVRVSSVARDSFDIARAPTRDDSTTLVAHYDSPGVRDADFSRGDPTARTLPRPYSPARGAAGRFGAGLDVRQSPTFRRFDAVIYKSANILDPREGTIELWTRPTAATRFVADGTLVDAGGLTLSIARNVISLDAGGLSTTFDLSGIDR